MKKPRKPVKEETKEKLRENVKKAREARMKRLAMKRKSQEGTE